jgi:hypothetical protein
LELRVSLDQPLSVDERGKVRLVSDVEEDGEDADEELERKQVPDPKRPD